MLLLRVLTGSRLFGFHTPSSDWDYLEVTDSTVRRGHTLADTDGAQWGLGTFMRVASKSSHNALDAMFAPDEFCEVDVIKDLRHGFRCDRVAAYKRFTATIDGVSGSTAKDPLKKTIFGELLQYNLQILWKNGRYDPTAFRKTLRGKELHEERLRQWEEAHHD